MKRRNRSAWKAVLSSPFSIVGALIIFGFLARAAWGIHEKAAGSAARLDQAKAELAKLEAEKESLSAEVAGLSTAAGVEASLRQKYRAVSSGESVAVIVDGSNRLGNGVNASSTGQVLGWWQRLLRFIGLR